MRPFGCSVTILNTLDHLGKFKGKADEGFLVGYSVNSKAFRVYNTRTKKVEENLHIKFLENKPNVAGSGPEWLFDIDSMTKSMNYELVFTGNQTNDCAGIETNVNAVQTGQEKASNHEYILLPFLKYFRYSGPIDAQYDEFVDNAGKKNDAHYLAKDGDENGHEKDVKDQEEGLRNQFDLELISLCIAGAQCFDNNDLPTDPLMPDLEDSTGIFRGAYDDEDVGAEADLNNLETTMNVSPIPTTRIHKDHPKDQIIGDINSAIQTRRMINFSKENVMIEAMQEELLQFKLQKVLTLVHLPNSKRAIGTKIEAIKLFLAYASFMGFIVYQMDVKSAFLYCNIEEGVRFDAQDILDEFYGGWSALSFLGYKSARMKDRIFISKINMWFDILKKFAHFSTVIKIHTDHSVADLLIKAFDVSRFNFVVASIGSRALKVLCDYYGYAVLVTRKGIAIPGANGDGLVLLSLDCDVRHVSAANEKPRKGYAASLINTARISC
ncbi:hypothetical protein Tco_1253028 [Tanacetum coccineum]